MARSELPPASTDGSQFELLVSSITDYAIYMLDPEGRIVTWNAGAERFKGYTADEIIGENFSRFFTSEDREADLPRRALRIAAREGRFEAEGWRVRKDGSRFWANAILDPIRDDKGKLIGFAKITRDITQRREADKALRQSEFRFQTLVNAVTDYAIYMLDPQGCVATWNAGARRIKGYEADEVIGEHFSRFFTPEDRKAGLPARILRTAAEDGRFEMEGVRVRKDGTRFIAHAVVDAIRDEGGKLTGFAKVTRDVSARRESERALFESEQRFKLLVQGVKDYAIYLLDKDGQVTNWNAGAKAIKGYDESEIVGQHFSRFYTEEDRSSGEPARALETALREGKYEREAWRVRKDGSLFWAHVLIDPIYDEAGEHVGFAKVTRDATERKLAEEKLHETQQALLQAQKLQALGELTGGIAHDFNNLMTVISGSVELLLRRDDLPEEKRERYLRAIAETADRATKLTSQLLAFGRRQPLRPEVIDLNVRVDALSEMLDRTLGSRIHLELDLAASLPHVEVDPTGLETAVLNAVLNARDAMPEGGRLTLRTAPHKDASLVCLEIKDSGEGIDPVLVERVFEPFFTTKPVGRGTGLGLSQIHGFCAQSGGRAEIESKPGKGTTVRLLLPSTDKPIEGTEELTIETDIPVGLNVLVVEDSPQVREFARHLLEDLHCHVTEAASADEALSLLAARNFDLVFSDVVMPGMSGVQLANEINGRWPGLPVLLATGYSDQLKREAGAGFTVLHKPYKPNSVAAAVREVLARSRASAASPIPT